MTTIDDLNPRLRTLWDRIAATTDWFMAGDIRATRAEMQQFEALGWVVGNRPLSHCTFYYRKREGATE